MKSNTPLLLILLTSIILFSYCNQASGQITGDYRTNGVGTNWGTAANWDRFNGTSWIAGASFPGSAAPIANTTVTIQNGHSITLDVTPASSINNLVVGGGTSGSLTIGNNGTARTLSMNGFVTVNSGATFQTGATSAAHAINIAGNLTVNGTINLGTGAASTLTFTGASNKLISGSQTTNFTVHNLSNTGAGTISFGDNANARVLNINNDFTISSGAFQSGSTGAIAHTINLSRNLTNNGGTLNFTANAATNHTFNFIGAAAKAIAGTSTTPATFYNLGIATGTVTYGDNANARSLTVSNDFTILSGAFQAGNSGAQVHTLRVGGDLTNSGTFDQATNGNTGHVCSFIGSTLKTLSGTGTYTFRNLDVNTTGSSNLNVNQNILVNTTLSFSANGILIVGTNANITLSATATISGNNSTRYIQLDGTTGTNSNLIRTTTNAVAPWQFTFPIGTSSGGYTPVSIPTIATAPVNNSTLSVKVIYNLSNQGQMRRTFRFIVTGNANATTFSGGQFNYNNTTDISAGDAESNYTSEWYLAASLPNAAWSNIATIAAPTNQFTVAGGSVATASLTSGTYYYTIAQISSYPNTWYSYQTGVWSNWQNWTSDPSGSSLVNGLNLPPQPGDEIVILNGITITNDVNGQVAGATTINGGGTLDMSTTTGNTLGVVSGTGSLKINGVALPTATYTSFVSTLGGTIEYYNTGGTLPTTQTTYNKLRLTATAGAPVFIMASNLTVNGTFDITTTGGTATWQINNNTANTRAITLNGDLTLGTGGRITVSGGTAATPHTLSLTGNLTNNGIIQFYDATDAAFSNANYTSGAVYTTGLKGNAVNVTFSGAPDNTVTCNGVTDFYRFIVNKGTGQQAVLTVNSSSTANFRLFGPTNIGSSGTLPNETSNNSLSIVNGTLQLTGSITIANLDLTTGNNYFSIPQNGALWLNGAGVTVAVTDNNAANAGATSKRLMLSGLLRVTAGTLNGGVGSGISSEDGGAYLQEGGTVTCWQFRRRQNGTTFSFNMTGGTLNVGYNNGLDGGGDNDNFARFDLSAAGSTFQMSGGTLNVAKPTNVGGGIYIGSSAGNYSVTGGTVNIYTGLVRAGTEFPFDIRSSAPLYNLNIYRESGTSSAVMIAATASAGPPAQIAFTGLTVLNDLTLIDGALDPTFNCGGFALTVGGNFNIQAGTTFTPGANVITLNGTGAQTWTHNGTITSLASVVMSKTAGTTLTLAGGNTFPNITTALTLTSGTLADGGKTITVTGTLTNNSIHSGAGLINYNNAGASTINGSGGTFGNLTISTNATIATNGNQTVTGTLRLVGANTTLNIGSNNLSALGNIYDAAAGTGVTFTATKRILTNGLHNAGGLTRQATAGIPLLFPVGTGTLYTPNSITIPTATTFGTITVRPVNSEHPNVTATTASLVYYWRVTSSGFVGLGSTITHSNYSFSTATQNGTTTAYRAARYDRTLNNWSYHNTPQTMTGNIIQPSPFNTGTGWTLGTGVVGDQLDGEYTCGNIGAFGTVTVFYSRTAVATPGTWNVNTTWSTVALGGVAAPAGAVAGVNFPGSNNPVIVGDASNNHGVIIDQNARSCGSLSIGPNSVVDCSTFTSLNFGTNTGGVVSGTGTLRIAAVGAGVTNMFPAGDFTNFLGANGGTVEWYGATKTIPATGPAPQNLNLSTYFNLVLNPNAANTITLPATNLSIFNNLTEGNQAGFTGTVLTNGARTIAITGNLAVSRGTFNFSNVAASATTLTIGGNTSIANGASMAVVALGTANTNTLTTPGGITNDGTINFNNTGVVNITFTGSNNVVFGGTGSGGTTLSLVNINKGTSQTPTVDFTVGGTVTAATSGWLTLTNGTFNFNNTGPHTIVSSAVSYTLPVTTNLKVSAGTVNVLTSNNTAADLLLNGTLEVAGGTVNIGNGANTIDNDIEYAATGTPTIIVSGTGALNVNGSIRRSTLTISGALVYNQTGGTTTVGGKASNNSRGVFEIDANPGSSFTLTGTSALTVQRQTNGTGYADLFINPITSNVSAASTIAVGLNSAAAQNNIRVNIAPSIGNFTVIGGGAGAQTANLFSNPMILAGTLAIQSPSVLVTNNLDVTIAGNLNIAGTYTGGTNTTTFNGTGAQAGTLSATSTFTNMTVSKTGGTTLTLSGTAPTLNNLNILSGILDVGSLVLTVSGNITNNSSQVGSGSINFSSAATTHTITSSNGSFTNLSLGVAAAAPTTKTITVNGNLTINGVLDFTTFGTNRYLFIGSNLLTLASGASVNNAGVNRFIKTNGVSSDLGVLRNWPIGTTPSFVYTVGTRTNYTPVTFTSLNVTGAGSYTVVPVDKQHPTANPIGEQLLSYYWQIKKGSGLTHNATGTVSFQVPTGLIGGASGTLIGSYLDALNPVGWVGGGSFTTPGSNTVLTFSSGTLNTVLPTINGQFDYTYGTLATLPTPIAPVYSRFADADGVSNPTTVANLLSGGGWATAANWTLSSTGNGAPLSTAPTNRPVVILPAARINLDILGQSAFTTQLSGLLVVTTTGHNIGSITGTGTMRTSTSTLPAGTYTTFTSATGGTIEYAAAIAMNSRSTYNNLLISSAGVTMTNIDLIVNGNVTINSGSSLTNSFGRNIDLAKNWINDGTFTAGSGGTVTLNGTIAQTVGGTSSTTFYGLGFNNSFVTSPQITVSNNTTVTNVLTMNSGIVNLAGNTLTLGSSGAASTLSRSASTTTNWIYGGTLCRYWPASTTISSASGNLYGLFPTGAATASSYRPFTINSTASPTGTGSYCVTHIEASGVTDLSPVFDDAGTNIVRKHNAQFVGSSSAITGGTYDISATMTGLSAGTLSDIRLAVSNGASTVTTVGTHVAATGTATNPTANRTGLSLAELTGDFRVTTTNIVSTPLPIELTYFNVSLQSNGVAIMWGTASELNNDFFTIERSSDGEEFKPLKTIKGKGTYNSTSTYFELDEAPLLGTSYYRLKQTDFDKKSTYSEPQMIDNSNGVAQLKLYPNPVVNNQLNVELSSILPNQEVALTILTLQGSQVHQSNYVADADGSLKKLITLSSLPSGVYIVVVNSKNSWRKKIVIP
ncbi:MAG: T9SS type A sorting domain-containing protein [Bacteroidetes bacterium]|nr:T9SS type A sorting domain-containing protein [Bacteroidota bacterium]